MLKYIMAILCINIATCFGQEYIPCKFVDQEESSYHRSLLISCGGPKAYISAQSKIKKIKFKVVYFPETELEDEYREAEFEVQSGTVSTLGMINNETLHSILSDKKMDPLLREKIKAQDIQIFLQEVELHPQTPVFKAPPQSFSSEEDVFYEESLWGILSSEAEPNKFVLDYQNKYLLPLSATQETGDDSEDNDGESSVCSGDIMLQFGSFVTDHFEDYMKANKNQRLEPEDQIVITLQLHKKLSKKEQGQVMLQLAYCIVKDQAHLKERISEKLWSELSQKYKQTNCQLTK